MNPIFRTLQWYFNKSALPFWCIFLLDGIILFLSGLVSYWMFHSIAAIEENFWPVSNTLLVFVFLSFIGTRAFHTYAGILRFSSFVDLQRVAYANILSAGIVLLAHFWMYQAPEEYLVHTTTREILTMFFLATLLMWALRIVVKNVFDVLSNAKRSIRVLIYGAMSSGVGLAKNIRSQKPSRYRVKGFITPDPRYRHNRLLGEKVYSLEDDLQEIIQDKNIEGIIVDPNRSNEFRYQEKLQDILIENGVKIFMAQNAQEWINIETSEYTDSDLLEETPAMPEVNLKEVSVEDLLPREEINVDMESVEKELKGKCILITGAAGSIGSELVRQVAAYKPALMILIDQAETPEHDIRLMMAKDYPEIRTETIVTSICNKDRMERIFADYRPDYVFHAAAYKHVPMMEDNPSEAVQNNVYGTKVIADLAHKYGTKKFVMVSTDKAVNPTNVMGCSKRICEIYVQSLNKVSKTQFVTTRFGNVLGSSGSVIPLFREQIKNGGPVTVTHPNIIRYFMLIPEACKLVLEAGAKGNGGEIFIFDMGKPVKIADLAQRMIKLSGAQHIKIQYTGLRAGEKLYEEVLNKEENTLPSFHEKIRITQVREYEYKHVVKEIEKLIAISGKFDDLATVRKMKEIVPEYKSNNSIYEELD